MNTGWEAAGAGYDEDGWPHGSSVFHRTYHPTSGRWSQYNLPEEMDEGPVPSNWLLLSNLAEATGLQPQQVADVARYIVANSTVPDQGGASGGLDTMEPGTFRADDGEGRVTAYPPRLAYEIIDLDLTQSTPPRLQS